MKSENGRWGDPPIEGSPIVLNRRRVEDQLMIAEPRLIKNKKENFKF